MTTWLGEAILAITCGAIGGLILVSAVRRLLEPDERHRDPLAAAAAWATPVGGAVVGFAVWWWEVASHGLWLEGFHESPADVRIRLAAHAVLLLLLAAATWIDFRQRVIPDAITVPGVLGGLAWMTLWPRGLLPVVREVPRSFAPPLRESDVLGLVGPLHGPWPEWLSAAPGLAGLATAVAVFAAWWFVGTAPAATAAGPRSRWGRLADPRWLVAAVGLAIVAGGWLSGGDHWRALASSLGGLAVAAGIVWLTRAGASLALGREAMGLGDVTLMAMVGAWLGWQACVLACFLGVFIGLAHGVVQLVLHGEAELPFGPSLCLAAAVVVLGWRGLWGRTADFFEHPLDMAAVVVAVIALTGLTLLAWHRVRGFSGS